MFFVQFSNNMCITLLLLISKPQRPHPAKSQLFSTLQYFLFPITAPPTDFYNSCLSSGSIISSSLSSFAIDFSPASAQTRLSHTPSLRGLMDFNTSTASFLNPLSGHNITTNDSEEMIPISNTKPFENPGCATRRREKSSIACTVGKRRTFSCVGAGEE